MGAGPAPALDGRRLHYGAHPVAFGDLYVPETAAPMGGPLRVVTLVHGGFWRDRYRLDLMEPLIPSLLGRGAAVWNIEYRRVGAGGGYPTTLEDVGAAIDHLAVVERDAGGGALDLDDVSVVGHSAGGHLALWSATRAGLPANAPGADPVVLPRRVVSQAGVTDLADAAAAGLSRGACAEFLGGAPADEPGRCAIASPIERLPIDADVLLVHGVLDVDVPVGQTERFARAARAVGMPVDVIIDPDAGHDEHLDPAHRMWASVLDAIFG